MMKFETPSFWYRPEDSAAPLIETAMAPFSCLYGLGHKIHQTSKKPQRLDVPVVCVGNIVAGGSGKTPTAIALTTLIKRAKLAKNPFFLTRGYGGHLKGPVLAHPQEHDYKEVGDEALILSGTAPTIVAEDRMLGAEMAIEDGADTIVMDDGLQNPSLYKDLRIVVIHGDVGFGNRKILPAGPLRTPLLPALMDAHAFVIIGEDKRNVTAILPAHTPVFTAKIKPVKMPAKTKPYIAFAGIWYPDKFFNTLKEIGCDVLETQSFPDHYPYHRQDIEGLIKRAKDAKAQLITTEKDFQRLPHDLRDEIKSLPVMLDWDDETAVLEFLSAKLAQKLTGA